MRHLFAYVAAESSLCIEKRMFSATTYCRTDQYCPSFYNQLMVTIFAGTLTSGLSLNRILLLSERLIL